MKWIRVFRFGITRDSRAIVLSAALEASLDYESPRELLSRESLRAPQKQALARPIGSAGSTKEYSRADVARADNRIAESRRFGDRRARCSGALSRAN